MRSSLPLAWLLPLALTGCSGSDDVAGPDADPGGPPVLESYLVTDPTLLHGEWTQLRWRVPGATTVAIDPDVGPVSAPENGAVGVRPYQSTTYTLTAGNRHGVVSASVSVVVEYPAALYVDSIAGDDAATGARPAEALATLTEALARTASGGFIFVSAGEYDAQVVVDGVERAIHGARSPTTFFEDPQLETWIRPSAAVIPLIVRNSSIGPTVLRNVKFSAGNPLTTGGEVVADVENSLVIFQSCTLEGARSASGTGLRVRGTSDVRAMSCQIRGGRTNPGPGHAETRGVEVLDAASLLLSNCFVDGGWASVRSSGVDVATTGSVRLGFNTISAHLNGIGDTAAAVRLRAGHPALGGNILFTRGTGERHAIVEESEDSDPSWLLGNLFVSAGTPPYDNHGSDGPDAASEAELNDPLFVNGEPATVYRNVLITSVGAGAMLVNLDQADYHLVPLVPLLGDNPAVNRGDALLLDSDRFGSSPQDIDGDARPGSAADFDLGADEL